ncbi:MAG: glycosyltransferase family 61 protein [Rhodobacteraceae bacterium]|nr:glycosyltransferase family 61 protein [Paracoccaceae bacterium]
MTEDVFDPAKSVVDRTIVVNDAVMIPWADAERSGFRRWVATLRSDGNLVPEAACWRSLDEVVTVDPDTVPDVSPEDLPGRWLFGGIFYAHFGHFLCETLSRLWALDHVGPVDGIIFYPKKKMTWPNRLIRPYQPFFDALGFQDLKIIAPNEAQRIGELVVPEQGFGVGEMAAGRPEFRTFMIKRLGQDIQPNGPEKIYVSRSRLMSKRGTILAEQRLEDLLMEDGYEIFHPQEHAIHEQIARYKAAKVIVSMDASPLHLAGFVVDPTTKVAILNRAPSRNIDDYVRQFKWFRGITPATLDTIERFWSPADKRLVRRETIGLLDYGRVGAFMAERGFVTDASKWHSLSEEEVSQAVAEREERLGTELIEYKR